MLNLQHNKKQKNTIKIRKTLDISAFFVYTNKSAEKYEGILCPKAPPQLKNWWVSDDARGCDTPGRFA